MVTKSHASTDRRTHADTGVRDDASAARPDGSNAAGRKFRSLRLGWIDPESGEELVVDVRGPASFLHGSLLPGIEEHGFVVLEGDASTARTPSRVHATDTSNDGSAGDGPSLVGVSVARAQQVRARAESQVPEPSFGTRAVANGFDGTP